MVAISTCTRSSAPGESAVSRASEQNILDAVRAYAAAIARGAAQQVGSSGPKSKASAFVDLRREELLEQLRLAFAFASPAPLIAAVHSLTNLSAPERQALMREMSRMADRLAREIRSYPGLTPAAYACAVRFASELDRAARDQS